MGMIRNVENVTGNLLMLDTHHPPGVAPGAEHGYDIGFGSCWKKKGRHLGREFLRSRSWGQQQTFACGLPELLRKTKVMGSLLAV